MTLVLVLRGGLGNQLFQIAAATGLRRGDERWLVDTTLYRTPPPQGHGADPRSVETGPLIEDLGGSLYSLDAKRAARTYQIVVNRIAKQHGIRDLPGLRILTGTFIGSDTPETGTASLYSAMVAMRHERQVGICGQAVHLRLGDYVRLKHYYGEPDAAYYQEAADLAFDPHREVCVFSDEEQDALHWFREHVKGYRFVGAGPVPTNLVHGSPPDSWSDLWRMSLAERLVVGNSTYSWWAGWMAMRDPWMPERRVIAPERMPVTELAPPLGALGAKWVSHA